MQGVQNVHAATLRQETGSITDGDGLERLRAPSTDANLGEDDVAADLVGNRCAERVEIVNLQCICSTSCRGPDGAAPIGHVGVANL